MNIAQIAVPGVFAPLQSLWRWFIPATAHGLSAPPCRNQRSPEIATHLIAKNAHCTGAGLQNQSKTAVHRPLRIVRVLEVGQTRTQVGRMTISGRMADVCAELDRLAAREVHLH